MSGTSRGHGGPATEGRSRALPLRATVAAFVRLRWRLLGASLRGRGSERLGVVVSTIASLVVGIGLGLAIAVSGRTSADDSSLFVAVCALAVGAVLAVSIVAGVTQPLDPRVISTEPLTDAQRAVGLLAATASGPPGLAAFLMGVGLVVGGTRGATTLPIVVLAATALMLTLLLVSRTAVNLLGLTSVRYPRLGQLVVALSGLVFYGGFQLVPAALADLDDSGRRELSDALALTPPGQLGRAVGAADESTVTAAMHLLAGAAILPLLLAAHVVTTRRLGVSTHRAPLRRARRDAPLVARLARWACGPDAVGAVAWRGLLTRFRTPRTAVETFAGAGVGMAAILVPTLLRDDLGGGAVLVGGAIQLAVLFMAGNSFGSDGPPLTWELLTGADPRVLAAGKARSIAVVASPLALGGPLVVAAVTDEWQYLPAGVLVGIGALLAGTGGAIVQSTLVPVAIPDSENPFASGESGRGIVAALLLGAVLLGLAVVTLPVGLALLWANEQGSVPLVTLLGAVTVGAGWLVTRAAVAYCARKLTVAGPEFVAAITPSR